MSDNTTSIYFGILTPANIGSREKGRIVLETLLGAAPEYTPDKYNYFEPVNRPFNADNLDEVLDAWRFSFFWRTKKGRVSGTAFFGGKNHSSLHIGVSKRVFQIESALRLLQAFQRRFPVDLSYVHVADPRDAEDREHYRQHVEPFLLGLGTPRLRQGLPDLSWAMFFGPPYLELFGRERILNAPAEIVDERAGGIYVQLTADMQDVSLRREAYIEARNRTRNHLNSNAFANGATGDPPRVPNFIFASH